MSNLFTKLKPFVRIFQTKTGLTAKIEFIIVLLNPLRSLSAYRQQAVAERS